MSRLAFHSKCICISTACSLIGALAAYYIIQATEIYYGTASREAIIGLFAYLTSLLGIHLYCFFDKNRKIPLKRALAIFIIMITWIPVSGIAYGTVCFLVAKLTGINNVFIALTAYVLLYIPANIIGIYNLFIFRKNFNNV